MRKRMWKIIRKIKKIQREKKRKKRKSICGWETLPTSRKWNFGVYWLCGENNSGKNKKIERTGNKKRRKTKESFTEDRKNISYILSFIVEQSIKANKREEKEKEESKSKKGYKREIEREREKARKKERKLINCHREWMEEYFHQEILLSSDLWKKKKKKKKNKRKNKKKKEIKKKKIKERK